MNKKDRLIIGSFVGCIGLFILVHFITAYFLTSTVIDGHSMDYTLFNNERVLVVKHKAIQRNQIVVFYANSEDPKNALVANANTDNQKIEFVKRVIAVPGDTVRAKNGQIYVNNKKISQPYLSTQNKRATGTWTLKSLSKGPNWVDKKNMVKVPKNQYFVLGDNREISEDSRIYGVVDRSSIIGVVYQYPWNRINQR